MTKKLIGMNKVLSWVFTAALICSAGTLSSCFTDDNPVNPEPVENTERLELEASLSKALEETSKEVRLDVGKDVLKNLTDIITSMNAEALKELKYSIINTVINNAANVFFEDLSEEEYAVVHKCMVERFAMTDEDFSEIPGFLMLDAYQVFGHMKVTFQDGQFKTEESDFFTIENIDKDGHSTSLTIKFNDEKDGVRFFVDRVKDITPICVQYPKQVEVSLKTADGKELSGTLSLSSVSPFQYISVKDDEWHGAISLESLFDGHHDNYKVSYDHSTEDVLNVSMDIICDGVEKFTTTVKSAHGYKIDMSEVNDLNSLSTFDDLLEVFEGGAVDEIQAVLNNVIVAKGKVKDVTACANALADLHELSGTNPGFGEVDVFTQRLNENLDFSISLKGHTTAARSSLVTYKPDFLDEEYEPCIALQYPGEPAPMVIFDRMSNQDKVNYKKIRDQIKALSVQAKGILTIIREKIQSVKELEGKLGGTE